MATILTESAGKREMSESRAAAAPSVGPILIVDDDPAVVASLSLLLKQAGYRSESASGPAEGPEERGRSEGRSEGMETPGERRGTDHRTVGARRERHGPGRGEGETLMRLPFVMRNLAASYSPRDDRPKYHRRWRA